MLCYLSIDTLRLANITTAFVTFLRKKSHRAVGHHSGLVQTDSLQECLLKVWQLAASQCTVGDAVSHPHYTI
eukprot:4698388-Amphidinium_carterae.1